MSNSTQGLEWHQRYLFATFIFEIVFVFPTVFGNSLLIHCIRANRSLHTRSFILMANLAVADLLCGLLYMPYDIVAYIFPQFQDYKITCLLRNSLAIWVVGASILNLLLMSIDRFLAISKPLLHLTSSKNYLVVLITISWVASASIAHLPLFGWNSWNETEKCTGGWLVPIATGYNTMLSLVYVTSLTITFILMFSVVRTAIKKAHNNESTSGSLSKCVSASRSQRSLEKAKMFVTVLVIFVLSWLPYTILSALESSSVFGGNEHISIARSYSSFLTVGNSSVNWVIYGFKNDRIKRAFVKVLCRRKAETRNTRSIYSVSPVSCSMVIGQGDRYQTAAT